MFRIRRICRCKGCGFCFADPYPAAEDLGRFYQEYYANRDYSAKLGKKIAQRGGVFSSSIKRAGIKLFLDVGCNVGAAVQAAHLCGLAASGIEIDKESVAMAQDLFRRMNMLQRPFRILPGRQDAASISFIRPRSSSICRM